MDTGGGNPLDRYAEQLWLTMLAKAPEITLFDFRQMIRPIDENSRGPWQGSGTSFDFDQMKKPLLQEDGTLFTPKNMSRAAGYSLEVIDEVLGSLGNPLGIKSYKPSHYPEILLHFWHRTIVRLQFEEDSHFILAIGISLSKDCIYFLHCLRIISILLNEFL